MPITAILIDDEYSSSEILQYELDKIEHEIEVIGIYEDPIEGIKAIKEKNPDLIFLDIEMPRLTGFEVLDILGKNQKSKVIFVTAYNKYAVNAFEYFAVDYLLKPVDANRLNDAIEKVKSDTRNISQIDIRMMSEMIRDKVSSPDKIVIPISNGYQMIEVRDIIQCKADNNYTNITMLDGQSYYVSKSLIHFEKLLMSINFIRVHQSYLVNMNQVKKYIKSDGGHLVMINDIHIPVSRGSKASLIQFFKSKSV